MFLQPSAAAALALHLQNDLEWNLALRLRSKIWDATPAEQQSIGLDRLEAMALTGADDEFRYLYDVVRADPDPAKRALRGLLVDRLADAWETSEAKEVWYALTGRKDISSLLVNATRYRRGHFLTRHDDQVEAKRVYAFTLSLSHGWRAEWGGLLEFVDAQGDIEHAFTPIFNSLVLFELPREHIVSAVSPLAPAARLTISGWLLTGPD